jgi:hypothetical protein
MQPGVRYYTLAEANAKVRGLEAQFKEVDRHLALGTPLKEQVTDLQTVWGERVLDVDCPGHAEFMRYKQALDEHEAAIRKVVTAVHAEGIEIKDLSTGLIDFYAKRGTEVVFLCWKKGEAAVGFWHTLQGGFAGRKPIKDF